ncbi:DNA cytosine methyltransferase [Laspinema sp. D1]|uniref:Cytosine-specific methyltransferase n=1 Tax=Laspinema palackyanum D2a TaxID=2953684 RepID=A0ABT2MS31_9CYAN|nr:DNA cytosine methyltransferase [Laspinema sp. D2a]
MPKFKVIDLFCGCGGLSWGFKSEGFEIILGADMNPIALKTFAANFAGSLILETDLAKYSPYQLLNHLEMEPGELDCLIGGPPCQGFSKNVPRRERFESDIRNRLMLTFLDFVQTFKPKIVLLENVAEMKNAFNETYTNQLIEQFNELGYELKIAKLLATDYGVPQLRRRTFFFANRIGFPVKIPQPTHIAPGKNLNLLEMERSRSYVTVLDALSDLPPLASGGGISPCEYPKQPETDYQYLMQRDSPLLHDHIARALTEPQLERVKHLEPGKGQGVDALPQHLRPRSSYSGAYARLIPDEPARTITRWVFHPGSGRFYHPFDNRVITIREAARLQSFPDRFIFQGTYIQKSHQVGEAVPPLVAQAFAKEAITALFAQHSVHCVHKV